MNLINEQGQPLWGRLSELPDHINWRDYDCRSPLGQRRAEWTKPYLFKHFDFYGAVGEGFTFGCGMIRLGFLNSLFAYVHTPSGMHKVQFDLPLDWGFQADFRPLGETTWFHPFRKRHWARSIRTENHRQLEFSLGPDFHGNVAIACSSSSTLALNTPIANTGFAYAQKTSGWPVSGEICWNGRVFKLNPLNDGCYHDWTAGFLRRETFWNWACASGRASEDQPLISVNLARGVNETSAHENTIWVDGALHELPLVLFEYDRDDVRKPWRVYSQCGAVDLQFRPEGSYSDHRQAWVLASRFNQCLGKFSGVVRLPSNGTEYRLDGLKGWCEDHYAKW
ncbi:MAG TPA: DUF2804 domain-containing protein [Limnobacter sp.]|nr:DUF2804 domain-containing protein [Limnobacter sp.]